MTIQEICAHLGLRYTTTGEHARPGWLQIDCPDCGPGSGKFHLGINLRKVYTNCWKCGPKWLPAVLSRASGVSIAKIRGMLAGLEVDLEAEPSERVAGRLSIPHGVGELSPVHREYLKRRRFDPDEIAEVWGVRGIGLASKLAWRLWIPFRWYGETVSWTTRAVADGAKAKYVSAAPSEEKIHHKDLLYGEELAGEAIVIVEGPIDVWRVGPGAVAVSGLNWTRNQIKRMIRHPRRVICFDNEYDAQMRATALARELAVWPGETLMASLSAPDPGSATDAEIRELRRYLR